MRKITAIVSAVLVLLAISVVSPVFANPGATVTVHVIGPDGTELKGATVKLVSNATVYTAETNSTGYAVFTDVTNDTYAVALVDPYYAFTYLDASNSSITEFSVTLNMTTMNKANVTTPGIELDFNATVYGIVFKITSPETLYGSTKVTLSFPEEHYKFPYRYIFDKITYDTTEIKENEVTIDLAVSSYDVEVTYIKGFYFKLEDWMVPILAVIAFVILIGVLIALTRAGEIIREERRYKYISE